MTYGDGIASNCLVVAGHSDQIDAKFDLNEEDGQDEGK